MAKVSAADSHPLRPPTRLSKLPCFLLALILSSTIVIYLPSLNAPFILDDIGKIEGNADIKDWNGVWAKLIYPYREPKWERNDPSRPITYLTFALNHHWGGARTSGYHVVNLSLHLLVTLLLFMLTRKILFYADPRISWAYPMVVAALFAFHPLNSNVVSYIFNRSGLLATLFMLSSLLLFISAAEGRRLALAASILSFVLAIFSKQDALTLPALILIFDYIFLSDFDMSKVCQKGLLHLPFWVVLAAYLGFRHFYLGGLGDLEAGKNTSDWPRLLYLAVEPYALMRYLQLFLVPKGLCIDHFILKPASLLQMKFIASYLLLAGGGVISWIAYKRKSAASKIILFSILWVVISLSPTSSIFPTTTILAENRVYLPSAGFYWVLVLLFRALFRVPLSEQERLRPARLPLLLMWTLLAAQLSGFATVTMSRNRLYANPALLWEDALSQYPYSARAIFNAAGVHNNRGITFRRDGDASRAIREFETALALNPGMFDPHLNLGLLYYFDLHDYDKAILEFKKALAIEPGFAEAHFNLGMAYHLGKKDSSTALREFLTVVALDPKHPKAHYNLGVLYLERKEYDKAISELQAAAALNPASAEAHNPLGYILYLRKDYQGASREYTTSLRLDPENAFAQKQLAIILGMTAR